MRKIYLVFFSVIIASIILISYLSLHETVSSLEIKYNGTFYQGETPSVSDVTARLLTSTGKEISGHVNIRIEEGDPCAIIGTYGNLMKEIFVNPIRVKSVKAFYDGSFYSGEVPDRDDFHTIVSYEDGREEPITAFDVPDLRALSEETCLRVITAFGDTYVTVRPVLPEALVVSYHKEVLYGDEFDPAALSVVCKYEDGREETTDEYRTDAPHVLADDCEIKVTAGNLSGSVAVTPVHVVSTKLYGDLGDEIGDKPGISGVTFVYANGKSVDVDRMDLSFEEDLTERLREGDNVFHFSYRGQDFKATIHATTTTLVDEAKRLFAEEYRLADYRYESDSIFVTVTKHKVGDAFYFLSHIVINDPSQLRSGLSHGDYGGQRELPTDAAKRLNWVIGTNGSNFNYGTGTPEYAGVCIKNGQVMEGTRTNGMEICLMNNGVLFSPDPGVDPQRLIESGVTDSWSCGDTLLINDGYAVNVGIQSEQYRYPRTAIGMVQPCEYYLITAGNGNYKGGMTYDEVRAALMSKGCSFGKCMDGGGSSSLVFLGDLLNTPAVNDDERAVVDFLYFVEYQAGDGMSA